MKEEIFMDDYSYVILKTYSKRGSLSLHDLSIVLDLSPMFLSGFVLNLCKQNLLYAKNPGVNIMDGIPINAVLEISSAGHSALNVEDKSRHSSKMSVIRSWLSLLFSVIAIIISVIAIIV